MKRWLVVSAIIVWPMKGLLREGGGQQQPSDLPHSVCEQSLDIYNIYSCALASVTESLGTVR